jgi:cation transport ATPase
VARAFEIFMKNLGLVLPVVILVIGYILLLGFVTALGVLTRLFPRPENPLALFPSFSFNGLLTLIALATFGVLAGIVLAILSAESKLAVSAQPYTMSAAWQEVRRRSEDVAILTVIGIALLLIWSFVPIISPLLDLLTELLLVVGFPVLLSDMPEGTDFVSVTFRKIVKIADEDPVSFLVLLAGSFISMIPVLNFVALPYSVVLSTLCIREV